MELSGAVEPWPHGNAGSLSIDGFRELVWTEGGRHRRDLPWRDIDDAYGVLVSEVMLQQTQVKRVLDYWPRFMGLFPTIDALASAETSLVLEQWQGLGYNRRALALKRTAEICSETRGGMLPDTVEHLIELPGIGPATAAGVVAFAHDRPCVYLETNVRSVFLHCFFPDARAVDDRAIIPLVEASCPQQGVRRWYYSLLDYGAHLKKTLPNPSRRSRHHARQSEFEGSRRQKRSEIVRIVLGEPGIGRHALREELDAFERRHGRGPVESTLFDDLVDELIREGFFGDRDGRLMP